MVRKGALSFAVFLLASTLVAQQYKVVPKPSCEPDNCVSKVLSLRNVSAPTDLQDAINALRTTVDITDAHPNPSEHTISIQGTPDQVAVAEKLVTVLDTLRSSGSHTSSYVVVYQPSALPDKATDQVLQTTSGRRCDLTNCLIEVLYLPNLATPTEVQDVVNTLRTIADITSIVPSPSGPTVTLRGTREQIVISEKLVSLMERLRSSGGKDRSSVLVYELKGYMKAPVTAEPLPPLSMPCEVTACVIKAYYVPDFSTRQLMDFVNKVRTTTQMTRTSPSLSGHALVVRGNAEQIVLADKLMNE